MLYISNIQKKFYIFKLLSSVWKKPFWQN